MLLLAAESNDQPLAIKVAVKKLAETMGLSEEDRSELLPSGRQSRFTNRVNWTASHLRAAKLLESAGRGLVVITDRGKELLASNPPALNLKTLMQYPEFQEFRGGSSDGDPVEEKEGESNDTPEEAIEKSYVESRSQVNRSAAQKKLLDSLIAQVDFPLPDSMVDEQIDRMVMELKARLERRGKSLDALGKTPQEVRDDHRSEAEALVKAQLFLLAVASKEHMQVSPMEMDDFFREMAKRTKQEFQSLKHFHEQNNLMNAVKDRILADKAMDHIYSSAEITEIDPVAPVVQEEQGEKQATESTE